MINDEERMRIEVEEEDKWNKNVENEMWLWNGGYEDE